MIGVLNIEFIWHSLSSSFRHNAGAQLRLRRRLLLRQAGQASAAATCWASYGRYKSHNFRAMISTGAMVPRVTFATMF